MKKSKYFLLVSLVFLGYWSCTKSKTPVIVEDCPTTISFSATIQPLMNESCVSCHGAGGTSPDLTNHSSIAANASVILGTLKGTPQLMPQGGPALPDSVINKMDCWIQQGKLNN